MSCLSCTRGFSFLRQEKSCPGCGFSYCSKCINNKVFLPKFNTEKKVCAKCKKNSEQKNNENNVIIPPDIYYKRLAATEDKTAQNTSGGTSSISTGPMSVDGQIQDRLQKLKEDKIIVASEEEIAKRLQNIKGVPLTSDAEISNRLAKLKGVPAVINKPVLPFKDVRTEQEQADDLIKQYTEQSQIDTKYKNEFDNLIGDIESRIKNLKGGNTSQEEAHTSGTGSNPLGQVVESEDEDESVRKIVEKIKAEASLEENEISADSSPSSEEIPFCEICNEDAGMKCAGCKYMYCKQCFVDHRDIEEGCFECEYYVRPRRNEY